MSQDNIVLLNVLLYLAMTIYSLFRHSWRSLMTFLSGLYLFSAVCSYLLYHFPLYELTYTAKGVLSVQSCLYLFAVNFLLIASLAKADISQCQKLTGYHAATLRKIQKFLCIVFSLILLVTLPDSIAKFFSGRDLADMRDELYGTNSSNDFFVISLARRLFYSTSVLLLAISCIRLILLKEKDRLNKYALFLYGLLKMNTVFAVVSRATIIFSLLELVVIFLLFFHFLSRQFKISIVKWALVLVPFFYFVFSTISNARFGSEFAEEKDLVTLRYTGESNLNFMGLMYPDLKHPFHGYKEFPLYRRLLGLDYSDGLSREGSTVYDSYIAKHYHFQHPTYVFYGLAGSYYANWGPWLTLVIALTIFFLTRRNNSKQSTSVSTFTVIFYVILASFVAKGIFFEDFRNESGNLLYLYLLVLWVFLKNNGYSRKIYAP